MKLLPRNNRAAVSALRLALSLALGALLPLLLYGSSPSWWSRHGVVVENATPDDYAPVNQGQLKNIAKAAVAEMDAKLAGGAGDELHDLVNRWSNPEPPTNDFAPVNRGQLKNVAKPFYDRLIAAGLVDFYPWLRSLDSPDDFAAANVGQVKNLFSFAIPDANAVDNPERDRLAAGQYSANLALEAHALWSWGDHLGNGADFERNYPHRLSGLPSISSVSAGERHSVALAGDGTVWSWGENGHGQLGDGTNVNQLSPAPVSNLSNIVSVKAGGLHTLALRADGSVVAWGDNYYGQLGTGDTVESATPMPVAGLNSVRKIAAGYQRSVALTEDGIVWTWGYEHYSGQDIFNVSPAAVPELNDVVEIAAGYEHVVAVKSDGTVWTWGSNYSNQLGNGSAPWQYQAAPGQVANLTGIIKVASSYDHSLALASDGTVWAWGYNFFGQLGDSTTQVRQMPVQVSGLTDVIAIATAYSYSLAMKADGTVWAWGDGAVGTLPGADLHVPQLVGLGLLDTNHNGMDDRWEMQFLGNLDQSADADFDGDGISNRLEYLRGTDPRDYYNGVAPVIEIAGGNNQIGNPGAFLSKPFKVRLRNQIGQLLVNAPVTFSISGGSGALASTLNGPKEQTLLVRTDANGEAATYHALPDAAGTSTRTIASAGNSGASAFATFRGVVRFSLPPTPTPSATPDPNTSPTPTPSPTATPVAPYRYAIIDLGKEMYPIRINNQGVILMQGVDADDNWGNFRWKGGALERLDYAGANTEIVATDLNDAGVVVGYFRNDGPWVRNAENEIQAGLLWPANISSPSKISAMSAYRTFEPQLPGTFRQASFSAINNKNDVFGQVCTGSVRGLLFHTLMVLNSGKWPSDSAPPVVLSDAAAINNPPESDTSNWQGSSDTVTRANSTSHYIGRKLTPFATIRAIQVLGTETGMIDKQSVPFNPVDINEAGIVVGSAGADMVVSSSPLPQTTVSGASPLAINDHTRPAPSPAAQSSPAPSPQPTPVPAPQILAWVGNALVIWERQDDGQAWHPFGLEEMIPNMDGWESLNPYDMNDTGAIVGTAWYTDPSNPNAPGEYHAFLLVPVELMVDGNRDGQMSVENIAPDRMTEGAPYRFWLNNDHDEERTVDGDDREQDDYDGSPDFNNPGMLCERDLEDWSRLWINFNGIVDLIRSSGVTLELAWKPTEGGNVWSTNDGNPGIKIMLHDSQAGAGAADPTYLTEKSKASAQAHGIWGGVIRPVTKNEAYVLTNDFLQFVTKENPRLYLLFEGWTAGKGQLVLNIKKNGRKIAEYPPTYLELKDVKEMYERYGVGDIPDAGVDYNAPWPASHAINISPPEFVPPPDETKDYILYVHGWNMSPADKNNYGDTSFKRLWWRGYKGRFGCFRWPTFWFAGGERGSWLGEGSVRIPGTNIYVPNPKHFDASEHRAWASSLGLLDLCNQLNNQGFSAKLRIVAHSMGNVVVGEALRRSRNDQIVHTYVASQAALSAHSYDSSTPPMNFHIGFGPTTPDVYGHYFDSRATSYMNPEMMVGKAGRYFNYLNEDDYALNGIHWQIDQQFKPDDGYSYGRDLNDTGDFDWFYGNTTRLRFDDDRYEIFAWASESRSLSLGAQVCHGVMERSVDLKAAPFNFGNEHKYHSGQFRGMNMERWPYWEKLLIDFGLKDAQ
jgi:hypothetical protein